MRPWKILISMGVLVFVLALAYGGLDLAGAAGPPGGVSGDVTVQNTATNPVPVQQQGTSTVSGTVGIDPSANTVQLPSTETVQTRAADNPAFQPVVVGSGLLNVALGPNPGAEGTSASLYTVPAGKELVIQEVSIRFLVTDPATDVAYADFSTGDGMEVDLGSINTESLANLGAVASGSQEVQIDVNPGASVSCGYEVASSTGVGSSFGRCWFSGYLVTLPA